MDIALDLGLLLALEALLAERNVTRAAKRLRLSQPALSARLARLRDYFDDPLLLPSPRGMNPTAKALELDAPLHRALDELRGVVARDSKFDPVRARLTIAIAASDYVHFTALLPLALDLRKTAPNLRLSLRILDSDLAKNMASGEIDLAVMTNETAPSNLRSRALFRERYVLIARRGHPRVKKRLSLDEFCALEHVVVSPRGGGFTGPTDQVLAARGKKRPVVLSAAYFMFVPELVRRSELVALVPSGIVDEESRLQILEPPIGVEGFTISMLWHDRTHTHPGHRWVRERLVAIRGMTRKP